MPLESDFVRGVFQGSHTEEEFDTDHIHFSQKWDEKFVFVSETEDTGEMIKFVFSRQSMEEKIKYIGETKDDVITGIDDGRDIKKEIKFCPRCVKSWRVKDSEICENCSTVIRTRGVEPSR